MIRVVWCVQLIEKITRVRRHLNQRCIDTPTKKKLVMYSHMSLFILNHRALWLNLNVDLIQIVWFFYNVDPLILLTSFIRKAVSIVEKISLNGDIVFVCFDHWRIAMDSWTFLTFLSEKATINFSYKLLRCIIITLH